MKPNLLCFTLLTAAFFGGTSATGEDTRTQAEQRMAEIQQEYYLTGTVRSCVSLQALRDSRVIDNQTIFFKGPGRTAYLNKLPRRCTRLAIENRFAYRTSIGQLCHLDVITVVDNFGRTWSRCGLGKFQEMKSKETASPDKGK